jgi:DNA-binding transcriptional ArsR family regulator
MTNEDIVRRLDKLIAILQLAHHEDIEGGRARIRQNETNAAILELTATQKAPAGKLIQAVKKKTGESERTITRRITSLVDQGALERSGGGPTTAYKATGLV